MGCWPRCFYRRMLCTRETTVAFSHYTIYRLGPVLQPSKAGISISIPVLFGSVQFRTVQFGLVEFGSVRFGSVRFSTIWFSTLWFGTLWFSTVWFNMLWFSNAWFSTVWFNTLWFSTLWFSAVRYGKRAHGNRPLDVIGSLSAAEKLTASPHPGHRCCTMLLNAERESHVYAHTRLALALVLSRSI